MPEPTAAEVIPKTIIRENPLSPNPTSAEKLSREISQKVDEGSWREGLELTKKTPISESKIGEKVEQIGVERDKEGRKDRQIGPDTEGERYGQAKAGAELTKKFIEEGYDKLDDTKKGNLRKRILDELKSRPALAAEMSGMDDAKKQALAERILKDPRYIEHARKNLEGILELPNIDETIITNAQNALEDAQMELDDATNDQQEFQRRLDRTEIQRKLYERNRNGVAKGERAIELDLLRESNASSVTNVSKYEQEVSSREQKLQSLQQELEAAKRAPRTHEQINEDISRQEEELRRIKNEEANTTDQGDKVMFQSQMAGVRNRLTALRNESSRTPINMPDVRPIDEIQKQIEKEERELKNAQAQLDSNRNNVQRLKDLQAEESAMETQRDEIIEEKSKKDKEVNRLTIELKRRQKNLEDAKALRKSHEQDLVDGFNSTFESAANDWINDQVEIATKELEEELEKLKNSTNDNNEKVMSSAFIKRWMKEERKVKRWGKTRTETRRTINKDNVGYDFDYLMKNGPDKLMTEIFRNEINPDTNTPYTQIEIASILDNKDFMSKMQPEMIKQLLTRKHLAGGFSHEDIFVIEQTEWGKGMINQAIDNVDRYKETIEKAFGSGALNEPGFKKRFKEIAKANPLWMLLLLGIPVAALGALGATVAAQTTMESIKGQY